MADQCIVCLEPLDTITPDVIASAIHDRSNGDAVPRIGEIADPDNVENGQHIAKIRSCGHVLHDACLQEWTQKANSCPICRQAFHLVEVYDKVGGIRLSERVVEDKKQVAEFDPTAWIEDLPDDFAAVPCPICGCADEEEVLLLCDGCDAAYHTHCVELDRVPAGHWFCMECSHLAADRAPDPSRSTRPAGQQRHPRGFGQRTQAQVRRAHRRHIPDAWQGAWNQISSRVWDALNLDLDYDDDDNTLTEFRRMQRRDDRQRRDFHRWQQRLAIAGRQGARDVFRDAAQPMLDPRDRTESSPQTIEEKKAWDAFDRTRDVSSTSTSSPSRKRKSRSITASPTERALEPERKLKRPKTRRIVDRAGSPSNVGEASSHHSTTATVSSLPSTTNIDNPAPSFLSSLLKEVEASSSADEENAHLLLSHASTTPVADLSSPAASPISSNYSTPRAMSATPPPLAEKRPGSPLSLTSHVEPIYPPADYSPNRELEHAVQPTVVEIRQPRPRRRQGPDLRSPESSPIRPSLTIEAKEGINKIVRSALEPHYKKPLGITKDQYANINKLVSRMLYDKILDPELLEDEAAKSAWEKVASAEVAKAVEGLSA